MLAELAVPEKYDMLLSVHSWIYPDIQPVPEKTGKTYFARLYEFDGQIIPIIMEQNYPGGKVHVKSSCEAISRKPFLTKLNDVLGLSVSMSGALKQIEKDPELSYIAVSVAGIQPYQSPSVFEALLKTIIQQQISYKAANILTKRMVLRLSRKLHFSDNELFAFPSPAAVVKCGLSGLRELGLGYKAEYVYEIARLVQNEELNLEDLRRMSFEEVLEILKPIRGIGEWTVRTLAISGLGDFTVFPYDDLGVRNLMGRLFRTDSRRMTSKDVLDYSQNWGDEWPLVLYLLMSADVLGLLGIKGRQQMHKR